MENELVSVIVPVYNAKKYILETIKSVQAQTYTNWELILVDDVSSDGTTVYLQELIKEEQWEKIQVITLTENSGAAVARNRGIEEAKGRYLCFLDADDLWENNKLELQVTFAKERKAGFQFSGYEFADEEGKHTGKIVKVPDTITYRQALSNTTIFTSTVLFDTEIIEKSKICFPKVKSEDTALWWKILKEYGKGYGLNKNLVRYRRTQGSLSSDKKEALWRIWNLYRNVENLSWSYSCYLFVIWAIKAILRRI